MDTKKTAEKKARAPYAKPRLRCVELATDEVLGVGCKSEGGLGPSDGQLCHHGPCSERGS